MFCNLYNIKNFNIHLRISGNFPFNPNKSNYLEAFEVEGIFKYKPWESISTEGIDLFNSTFNK